MEDKKQIIELTDDELDQVAGGGGYIPRHPFPLN